MPQNTLCPDIFDLVAGPAQTEPGLVEMTMKQKIRNLSPALVLVLLLAFAVAPQLTLVQRANAQERTINVNEKLDFRALGIDNEAKQFVSLIDVQLKFFKRGEELRAKSILSPRGSRKFQRRSKQKES